LIIIDICVTKKGSQYFIYDHLKNVMATNDIFTF